MILPRIPVKMNLSKNNNPLNSIKTCIKLHKIHCKLSSLKNKNDSSLIVLYDNFQYNKSDMKDKLIKSVPVLSIKEVDDILLELNMYGKSIMLCCEKDLAYKYSINLVRNGFNIECE